MPEIDKEAIKSHNKSAIEGGTGRLFQHQIELNQWAVEPIGDLFTAEGKRIPNCELRFLVDSFNNAYLQLKSGHHRLASRELMIGAKDFTGDDGRSTRINTITGAINTTKGLEGLGLSSALMQCTDSMVLTSLDAMQIPADQDAIYVVTDRAKAQSKQHSRTGWTSNMMENLGFQNDEQSVRDLVHLLELPVEEEEIEHTYYKVYEGVQENG